MNSFGPTTLAFAIDFKAAINSFSVGSTPRACVIGHWGNPSMMSSLSLSYFELRRVPKNCAHVSRASLGSRSVMPSLSRLYCELTLRVSYNNIFVK